MHNLTGFPVGVMPITDVAENEQTFSDNYNDKWTKLMQESAATSKGMPIGLQFIGYLYEDETILQIMKDVEKNV